jgi:ribosome-associated protein
MDISEISDFADYFVICSGTSDRMLQALADAVVKKVHDEFDIKPRLEGQPREGWLLADFGDVIVHLLSPDRRDYYRIEDLWGRGKVLLRLQ